MHKSIRNILLLTVLTPIIFILVWILTISKTINLSKENKQVEKKLEKLESAPQQVSSLEQQLTQLDQLIGSASKDIGGDKIFRTLTEEISKKSSIKIIDFPFQSVFENNNYVVNTYMITLQGAFFDLLKILNLSEQDKRIGKIVSVEYKVKKDLKTKQKRLTMVLYVQTYTKKTNNL
ncbi:MAG: hypothetical protein MI745_00070 [Pseudomonadales bacterium]|nr:hypothetical protein [Pseudomonadales bacterium]